VLTFPQYLYIIDLFVEQCSG